jgi:hypothetical protein
MEHAQQDALAAAFHQILCAACRNNFAGTRVSTTVHYNGALVGEGWLSKNAGRGCACTALCPHARGPFNMIRHLQVISRKAKAPKPKP